MKLIVRKQALFFVLFYCLVEDVSSHARLMEPPSRSSMWRFGYPNPRNYDDDGLYCGGMEVQHKMNGGKCGVCGDPWHLKPPRPNEMGGKYGRGVIVRSYKIGQVIQTSVDITANHRGYFEFRVCPSRSDRKEVIQECLDRNVLKIVNTTNTKYFVDKHGSSRVTLALQLPERLTCKRCVLQWTYTAGKAVKFPFGHQGNNWGKCKNGTYGLGCGSQETFKACSDIAIGSNYRITTASPSISTTTTVYQKPPNGGNKFPVTRPHVTKVISFEEALENIKKNPKLRWMLKPKKQNS